MKSRIIGLDPGLERTGYAIIESPATPRLIEAGVIHGKRAAEQALSERLATLHQTLAEILDEFRPQEAAIEQLYSHYERPRTAILMGHARGVVMLALAQRTIPVVSYMPTSIKKRMTGSGRATKDQMQQAVKMQFGLTRLPEPADVADAIAIAFCHGVARLHAA